MILWPDNNAPRIPENHVQILHNVQNTFTFIDDILVVTKGSKEENIKQVEKVMKILEEAGIRLKEKKCQIAQSETEWLGYQLTATGVKPMDSKIQAISDKLKPRNLKDLRSFMGAINQMNRFIPNLAKLCAPLRPLLSKDTKWDWKTEHDQAFDK